LSIQSEDIVSILGCFAFDPPIWSDIHTKFTN